MRRAVPATLLCVVSLFSAPAASADVIDRAALREVLRSQARASAAAPVPLPLPEPRGAPQAAAAAATELAAIARDQGPVGLLVGVRTHPDRPGVAAKLEGSEQRCSSSL